jgi:hypothetical protein
VVQTAFEQQSLNPPPLLRSGEQPGTCDNHQMQFGGSNESILGTSPVSEGLEFLLGDSNLCPGIPL